MTLNHKAFAAGLVFAAIFATSANANCGPANLKNPTALARFRPLAVKTVPMARPAAPPPGVEPSIAGLWSVQFTADGLVVDEGFDTWHPDGTEILNDAPAPASGAVCVGVWTRTAPYTYQLKHPSYIFDSANVNLVGVAVLREKVILDPSGDSYSGDLTIDLYDLLGNKIDHLSAKIAGMRIQVADDPKQTTGIPGLPVFAADKN